MSCAARHLTEQTGWLFYDHVAMASLADDTENMSVQIQPIITSANKVEVMWSLCVSFCLSFCKLTNAETDVDQTW